MAEIGYFVSDAAVAAQFWVDALGCVELVRMDMPREITEPTGMGEPGLLVAVRTPGGDVLKFMDCEGGFGTAASNTEKHDHYFTLWVPDLDSVTKSCVDAGARPLTPDAVELPSGSLPAEIPPGRMRFLEDPAGNAIELIEGTPPF